MHLHNFFWYPLVMGLHMLWATAEAEFRQDPMGVPQGPPPDLDIVIPGDGPPMGPPGGPAPFPDYIIDDPLPPDVFKDPQNSGRPPGFSGGPGRPPYNPRPRPNNNRPKQTQRPCGSSKNNFRPNNPNFGGKFGGKRPCQGNKKGKFQGKKGPGQPYRPPGGSQGGGGQYRIGQQPVPCHSHVDCYKTREPRRFVKLRGDGSLHYGKTGCSCNHGMCKIKAFIHNQVNYGDCIWCGTHCHDLYFFSKFEVRNYLSS